MKVIIAGSRWIGCESDDKARWELLEEKQVVYDTITAGLRYFGVEPGDCVYILGGATGVDTVAEDWVDSNGLEKRVYLPNWTKHGKSAGHIRNMEMAQAASPDGGLILTWDGKSAGSASMRKIALAAELKFFERIYSPVNAVQ
jgi:hypothetical protein